MEGLGWWIYLCSVAGGILAVSEKLFLNIGLCILQFKQAFIVDKPAFIEIFQERCVPKILKSSDFDYSRLEDESLEGVIDTTSICG